MQSYLVKTNDGTLNLSELSALVGWPEKNFVPELNWFTVNPEKESIGIAAIKIAIVWLTSLKTNDNGKVLTVNLADLMTIEAQNALLKNLEEPGDNNRLILITTNPDSLIDTIISRCQLINLSTSTPLVKAVNESKSILMQNLFVMSYGQLFIEVDKIGIIKNKEDTRQFIFDTIPLIKLQKLPPSKKLNLLKNVVKSISLLDQNVNTRIVLETFLLDLATGH